jgi:hypothetical protein
LNVALSGSTPPPSFSRFIWMPPLVGSGSGKSGTPFSRMHLAIARILAISSGLGLRGLPPFGRRWRHFCSAAFLLSSPSLPPVTLISTRPSSDGSGMSTPFARMHLAYSRILSVSPAAVLPVFFASPPQPPRASAGSRISAMSACRRMDRSPVVPPGRSRRVGSSPAAGR